MSTCLFIASDMPLAEFAPSQDYPIEIDMDKGTIHDGGADDNYFLISFESVKDYTDKNYGVFLEWYYTDGRARQIIEYIKAALRKSDRIEFWHVWLDYYEFENRPYIHKQTIPLSELTTKHVKEINDGVIWNTPDKMYPTRPSFYCLTVTR